jgi:hypothetical protein
VARGNGQGKARRAATRKLRALRALRLDLRIDAWPLTVSARNVVEAHWARYAGLQIFRASTKALERQRKPTKRKPSHRLGKRKELADE